MHILITADPELPVPPILYGGIERIVELLVNGLIDRGHEVTLVANPDSSIKIDYLNSWPGQNSRGILNCIKNINAMNSAINDFRPEIIHSFSRLIYMITQLPFKIPKIMSYQRLPSSHTIKNALRISRNTLNFTGCSDYICSIGRKTGGKWETIYNFVDTDKYEFCSMIDKNAPLVFLSRVERIKGAHNAIKAALNTGKDLIIAGNADQKSNYWKNEIKPYIGKNGIDYVGPVNDQQKNELLRNALAMVVPIEWDEPFGIVFTESLACGTPIISCPRGALPEIVNNGENGFLVDSVNGLSEAIEKVYEVDRDNCRAIAEMKFSSNVTIDKYENLYKSLI